MQAFGNLEGIVNSPTAKSIAWGRGGNQGAAATAHICARTRNGAALSRVGCGKNGVVMLVESKDGRQVLITGNGKGIDGAVG